MTAELVMNLAIGIIFYILGSTVAIRGYRRIRIRKENIDVFGAMVEILIGTGAIIISIGIFIHVLSYNAWIILFILGIAILYYQIKILNRMSCDNRFT